MVQRHLNILESGSHHRKLTLDLQQSASGGSFSLRTELNAATYMSCPLHVQSRQTIKQSLYFITNHSIYPELSWICRLEARRTKSFGCSPVRIELQDRCSRESSSVNLSNTLTFLTKICQGWFNLHTYLFEYCIPYTHIQIPLSPGYLMYAAERGLGTRLHHTFILHSQIFSGELNWWFGSQTNSQPPNQNFLCTIPC